MVWVRVVESANGVTQDQFARIVTTKDYGLGGLSNRVICSHHSGSSKSKIKVLSASGFLLKPLFLAPRWLSSSGVFTWSSVCVCVWVPESLSYEDPSSVALEFIPMTLNTSLDPISQYSHILSSGGLRLQHEDLRKIQISPQHTPFPLFPPTHLSDP